jgi:hypothetical protein
VEFVVRKTMRNVHEQMRKHNRGHVCGSSVHPFDPVPYAQYSQVEAPAQSVCCRCDLVAILAALSFGFELFYRNMGEAVENYRTHFERGGEGFGQWLTS